MKLGPLRLCSLSNSLIYRKITNVEKQMYNPTFQHPNLINIMIQYTLDLRKSIFPFLNQELFDLRKIYVVNLKTGRPKKMTYVGEFAT